MIRSARITGTEVIWDLCHYGWPDDVDVFSTEFIRRFARFARAFAKVLRDETDGEQYVSPLNEPSFLSWAGGDVGYINPRERGRGFELKQQLTRAIVEGIEGIWSVAPRTRIVHCEPAIHIAPDVKRPQDKEIAEKFREFQFQSLDMIAACGSKYIDLVGLNYYSLNQWIHNGPVLTQSDSQYRPFREMLREFHERYQCPVFVGETGIEGDARPKWLSYVANEVLAAREAGVPVEGICLYPILNHPGWDNDRYCHCGLLGYADENGNRQCYAPLESELKRWQERFDDIGQLEMTKQGRMLG